MVLKVSLNTGINRIRLEFKGGRGQAVERTETVLIESDWNLKATKDVKDMWLPVVLIESDWNLKL